MNASQLRALAREHAQGQLARLDYLKRRRELIDAVVAGEVPIERESPPPRVPPPPPSTESVAPPSEPARRRIHWYLALAGIVVIGLIAWALIPGTRVPPTQSRVLAPTPQRQISAARSLVEGFVAAADWSELNIARFENAWRALPADERRAAPDSTWWRRLSNALRQEQRTQKALAEIDQTGAAQAAMRRLTVFETFLRSTAAPPVVAGASRPAALPVAPPAAAPNDSPAAVDKTPTPGRELSGSAWLESQAASDFSLQLFALNHLDRVERLFAAHPDLDLKVIGNRQANPRYRVLYGSFHSEAAARSAYAALPSAVRREQPVPLVKGFAELRGGAPVAARATGGDWLAQQDRGRYALQIFVSNTRENVARLVARFPTLALQIHESIGGSFRYRVLLGSFGSEAAARQAVEKLPPALLKEAGAPVAKSISQLQDQG